MPSPLFSVIIPVYNRAHTILRAVSSVLGQTEKNFELIVVDDGSIDDPKKVLLPYIDEKKIIYIKQENRGVSSARNLGAKNAKGEWLAFLDSDDEWLPRKLELQRKHILANPQEKFIHGEEIWIRKGKRVNPKLKHAKGGGDQFISSLALCCISPSTVAIRKEYFFELGCFREDFPVCEDYDLWLKVTSMREVAFIEEPLCVKYGGAEDQLSTRYKGMDFWRAKSILWILKERDLGASKFSACRSELAQKIRILETGLRKKNDALEDLKRVQTLKRDARNFL